MIFYDSILLLIAFIRNKKHKTNNIVLLVFVFLFISLNLTFIRFLENEPVARILASIGIVIDIFTIFIATKGQRDKKKQMKTDRAIKFYEVCLENGISKCETEDEQKGIRLVAKNLGISEKDAVLMFKKGGEDYESEKLKKSNKEKEEMVKQAESRMAFHLCRKNMIGKAKYLQPYIESLKDEQRHLTEADRSINQKERLADALYREHNSSIAGGLAQGIAGVGAGLVTYAETERDNAVKRAAKNEFLKQNNSVVLSRKRKHEHNINSLNKFIAWYSKWIQNVIIDDDCNSLFDHVNITVEKQENWAQMNTGYLILSIKSTIDQDQFTVLNHPARLDGNVRIEAYEQGKKVGTGYYSPYGYGATDLSKVGFGINYSRTVMVKPDNPNNDLDEGKKYEFKFIPEKLWLIQTEDIGNEKRKEFEIYELSRLDMID